MVCIFFKPKPRFKIEFNYFPKEIKYKIILQTNFYFMACAHFDHISLQ